MLLVKASFGGGKQMIVLSTGVVAVFILMWFFRLAVQMGWKNSERVPAFLRTMGERKSSYPKEAVSRKEIAEIFAAAIAFRFIIYLISVIYYLLLRDDAVMNVGNFLGYWNRWDAPHYIELAQNGYAAHVENGEHLFLVFFPLYPWLVKLVHVVIREWQAACLVVSTLAYAVGCCFFYAALALDYGKKIAYKSVVLMSVYPFAFFYGAMMTESLFFCTISAGFYFIKKHNWPAVGVVGILCALCRVQGVIIMGVAGVELLTEYPLFDYIKKKKWKEYFREVISKGIWLLLVPIGNLIYFSINYAVEGDPFRFRIYQEQHWFHRPIYFAYELRDIVRDLFNPEVGSSVKMCIWMPETVLFVVTMVLLYYGLTRHPLKYTAYLLVYTMINYSVTWLVSGGRYMLCAFPLFIIAAEWGERHPKAYQWMMAGCAALMGIYLVGFFESSYIM